MSKQYTVKEVQYMIDRAKEDVHMMTPLLDTLNHVPFKPTKQQFDNLIMNFPPPEDMEQSSYPDYWRVRVDTKIKEANQSIQVNERWIQHRLNNPHRCAIPKKKQRELGILPPV